MGASSSSQNATMSTALKNRFANTKDELYGELDMSDAQVYPLDGSY